MCANTRLNKSWHNSYKQAKLYILHNQHSKQNTAVINISWEIKKREADVKYVQELQYSINSIRFLDNDLPFIMNLLYNIYLDRTHTCESITERKIK